MKKKYLECGKIVSTHGVRGELRVQPWCDTPDFLCEFKTLYLNKGETPLTVELARVHKNMVILKAKGYNSLDDAVTLRGKTLYIDREDAPESEGVFIQDLIGSSVIDADSGRFWGTLKDVISTGANDVYVLEGENQEQRLVPAIPEVVVEKDLDGGVIRIRPLKGLFED